MKNENVIVTERKKIQMELKCMRSEDKIIKRKKELCAPECICKRIATANSKLDRSLLNIPKINSKPYMDDYMKALGLQHSII